jgi:hypothetical protein
MAINEVWIPITMFGVTPIVAIGWPIARAYARRIDAQSSHPPLASDLSARLERMEQAIDSIAIEVERISEGQRFTAKLLAERVPAAPPSRDSSGDRAATAPRER